MSDKKTWRTVQCAPDDLECELNALAVAGYQVHTIVPSATTVLVAAFDPLALMAHQQGIMQAFMAQLPGVPGVP